MVSMLIVSYLGSFGGIEALHFPFDLVLLFPLSIAFLSLSQLVLNTENHQEVFNDLGGVPA